MEIDTDGSYVMSEKNIQESAHVNKFDKFILDIRSILEARKQRKNIRRWVRCVKSHCVIQN